MIVLIAFFIGMILGTAIFCLGYFFDEIIEFFSRSFCKDCSSDDAELFLKPDVDVAQLTVDLAMEKIENELKKYGTSLTDFLASKDITIDI